MDVIRFAGKRVGIWGLGAEGLAAARAAVRAGATAVLGADQKVRDSPLPGITMVDDTLDLAACDVVVRSPGVSIYDPAYLALARRTEVTGGTDLALEVLRHHGVLTIAITGTKGKSTTSALAATVLAATGRRVVHAGNIGTPLLDEITALPEPLPDGDDRPHFVLEVSSYQAADVRSFDGVGAVTSLYPEHLNWHGGEEHYYRDKLNLFAHAPRVPVVVSAQALDLAGRFLDRERLRTPDDVLGPDAVDGLRAPGLPGAHNASNLRVALATVAQLGVPLAEHHASIQEALTTFATLPHRFQRVRDVGGFSFVDDTLSTTPASVLAALEVAGDDPVVLILGGQDRGVDQSAFARDLADRHPDVTVVALPETGRTIGTLVRAASTRPVVLDAVDLSDAVRLAVEHSAPATVLLSPGAPSYHAYTNHQHLSRRFVEIIDTAFAGVSRSAHV